MRVRVRVIIRMRVKVRVRVLHLVIDDPEHRLCSGTQLAHVESTSGLALVVRALDGQRGGQRVHEAR